MFAATFVLAVLLSAHVAAECRREAVARWARTINGPARDAPDLGSGDVGASASDFWEQRYKLGGTSGAGSYGVVAAWKQRVVNELVVLCGLRTVVEFGFGDGHQLTMANYATYVGFDVSITVWEATRRMFRNDTSKSFLLYDALHVPSRVLVADLVLSLDVIYHMLTAAEYDAYLGNLFGAHAHWVVVYSSNKNGYGAAHVLHHRFVDDIPRRFPQFELVTSIANAHPHESHADFFIFRRRRIIATFTTFADRAPSIAPMIASVFAQTVPADEVRCYSELSRSAFGNETGALFDTNRITLRRAGQRLHSYKKLLPALEAEWQVDDLFLIALDDDQIYRPTLFFELLQRHLAVGGIVVDRGRQIDDSAFSTWRTGGFDPRFPHRTLMISGSGVLLAASVFADDAVLSTRHILELAPTADDLWWTAHAIIQNVSITEISTDNSHPIPQEPLSEHMMRNNDRTWQSLRSYALSAHGVDLLQRVRSAMTRRHG